MAEDAFDPRHFAARLEQLVRQFEGLPADMQIEVLRNQIAKLEESRQRFNNEDTYEAPGGG